LWVAEEGTRPVGLCWFVPLGGFGIAPYLRLLVVEPERQRKGIGFQLLTAFERETVSPYGWFLLVSETNTDAQAFYARAGYLEVGRLPDFAKPGLTELVMWKQPTHLHVKSEAAPPQ
jgi:ribosomal protein S18 acetylase RimI-like enzyme